MSDNWHKRNRFYKKFADLPKEHRANAAITHEKHGPVSWLVIKLEVDHGTKLSEELLNQLHKENLI